MTGCRASLQCERSEHQIQERRAGACALVIPAVDAAAATARTEGLNSEQMLDLRAQFIDFHLNLSHASQLNPELFVNVIDTALDFRRELRALTSGRPALPTDGSSLTGGSCLARGSCRPTRAQWSFFAFPPGWPLDATGTGRTRRTRWTGNALGSS